MGWQDYVNWDEPLEDQEDHEDQYFDECTEVGSTKRAWLIERPHSKPDRAYRVWVAKSIAVWAPEEGELLVPHWAHLNWKIVSTVIVGETDDLGEEIDEPPF